MPEWHVNRGKSPRDQTVMLMIEWANGHLARHNYTAGQLRWSLTNSPFDIGRYAKKEG